MRIPKYSYAPTTLHSVTTQKTMKALRIVRIVNTVDCLDTKRRAKLKTLCNEITSEFVPLIKYHYNRQTWDMRRVELGAILIEETINAVPHLSLKTSTEDQSWKI